MRHIHFMLAAIMCTSAATAQEAAAPPGQAQVPVQLPVQMPSTMASAPSPEALLPAPFLAQPISLDRSNRITLPVTIGSEGPFAFVVDTGAERTVIARQLAERLGLTSAGRVRVIGLAEAVITDVYRLGPMRLRDLPIDGHLVPAFDHANIGAAGLIGIDSLERHRVVLDFVAGRIDIRESPRARRPLREPEFDRDAIVVVARRSAGRMILSDARIGGRRIDVIVDTGAQSSLGNVALRDMVRSQHGHWRGRLVNGEIQSVTGAPLAVQMGQISRITVGGVDFSDLPVAYADSPAFTELGLSERPALLLGMDALQMFERVAIDFTNRRVTFDLPRGAQRVDPGRLALRTP